VEYLLLDFLMHIHQIAFTNTLTYDMLKGRIKKLFIDFMVAFPNMHTIVLMLDESEYTPLGKVPTQKKRGESLTMDERKEIVEGGVMGEMDPAVKDSIDMAFASHPDVRAEKRTPFSVFFSKYVRTRALRKDMVRMITHCLMELFAEDKVSSSLRFYIDGMSYSNYYAPSHSFFQSEEAAQNGCIGKPSPMMKRRQSASSLVGDVDAHSHMDKNFIRVCRIRHQSDPEWLTDDSEMFGGQKSRFTRPNMGESDIKIPYYLRRIGEMIEDTRNAVSSSTAYVSSWDTDCIPITMLAMDDIHQRFPSTLDHLHVYLDTKQGGTCRDLLNGPKKESKKCMYVLTMDRNVFEHEDEYLTEMVNVGRMVTELQTHFRSFYPGFTSGNEVEVFCLFMVVGGTDYVNPIAGIGFETLRVVFDVGGYRLLSEAVLSTTGEEGTSIQIKYDENKLRAFFNLCVRYKLGMGKIHAVKKAIKEQKSSLTTKIKTMKKDAELMGTPEESIDDLQRERDFLNDFMWKDHHELLIESSAGIEEGDKEVRANLVKYIDDLTGIGAGEPGEWKDVFFQLDKKRRKRVTDGRAKALKDWSKGAKHPSEMSDQEIVDAMKADTSDMVPCRKDGREIGIHAVNTRVRRVVWNMMYWKLSAFVCLRETKTLRSIATRDSSTFGFKSVEKEGGGRTVVLSKRVEAAPQVVIRAR
jgi:hypothetical protein